MQTYLTPAARRLRAHGVALRIAVAALGLLGFLLFSSLIISLVAQERRVVEKAVDQPVGKPKPNKLKSIAPDLIPPATKEAAPAPGVRVKQQLPERENLNHHNALYLTLT